MKYKCIKEFHIQMYDEDCYEIENKFGYVLVGSIWEVCNYDYSGGDVHLALVSGCDDFGWIEITNEHLEENFMEEV